MSQDIRKMIDKVKNFKLINEGFEGNNAEITISRIEPDERSKIKQPKKFHVNYQINVGGRILEIEGVLNPYNTGRNDEHRFEPGYFMDDEVENYYSENWEEIEDEILAKFSENSNF